MMIDPENLRALRLSRGWTQSHLADTAGLSLRTVQRVERDGNASSETVLSLAAVLDATPAELQRTANGQARFALRLVAGIGLLAFFAGGVIGAVLALSLG
ncbi:helix-turn-helix transcriptional regulator [Maricaulis sp.]|uniref:helix-turn-helix domain-containing protein n=1 Tax=Maricaulis sp. TaxID=1486257 RepID=UPI0026280249|nr:helix-turn-helix transcriptional regulator [Maricaulis sp.]